MQIKSTLLAVGLAALPLITQAAEASKNTCPTLEQIQRTPGEYSWTTTVPGWEGYFAAPANGRGYSNKVETFLGTRWIQFTNLPSSPGYVECDYAGDLENEMIRFVQSGNKATARPEDLQWSKVLNVSFPSVQRECSGSTENCMFEQL